MSFSVIGGESEVTIRNSVGTEHFSGNGLSRYQVSFEFSKGLTHIDVRGPDVSLLVPQLANGQRIAISSSSNRQSASSPAFTDSYDLVLANSAYTQSWIKTRWHRHSLVHYPPVELRKPSSTKENIILSVGRFFDESRGHSKQQLRLVRAFKKMVDLGLTDWKLVLIGGCDKANRDYALQVRREAVGYPIEVRLNAEFDDLDSHLARASIYWHATGFGVNLNEFPERAEHFGIAPVEAMSTGTIPVVYGIGGPREIVDLETNGYFFLSEEDLIERTMQIIAMSKEEQQLMRDVAIGSAARFSSRQFGNELLEHIHELLRA
jgi:glycosyltransferase involved in cell wall biosynthesis